jgi:hypothetical protein
MNTFRAAQASLATGGLIALTAGFGAACSHTHNGTMAHQHCMKIAGMTFLGYASEHGGVFPYHTNGFGDALLLLVKDNPEDIRFICGPGDDGHVFSNALAQGLDVPEIQCSRVYVQGLSQTNDPRLCILFDRRSVPGGDHFYESGKPLREVCMLDGFMETVPDARWAEFSRHQVELLVAAGFKREKALQYYPEAADR